jgi:PAS domain S-box-containing protein
VSSKQFLIAIEGTADAAFAVDPAGRITAWNTAASQLFGVAAAEAIGTRCHQLFQCADEDGIVCSAQCVVERAGNENHPQTNFDLRLQTKSGRQWCNLTTLIANDAAGARSAIYVVQLREMHKRFEQALSEFVRSQAKDVCNSPARVTSASNVNVRLTSREVVVLRSLANGHTTKAIAGQLNISPATVNNHIKHILTKLDAHTRLEAIRYAEKVGVI